MLSFCGLAKRINAHGKAKSKEEGYEEERAKETLICFSVNPRAVAPKSRRVRNERTIFQKATEPNLKWGVPSTGRLIFFLAMDSPKGMGLGQGLLRIQVANISRWIRSRVTASLLVSDLLDLRRYSGGKVVVVKNTCDLR